MVGLYPTQSKHMFPIVVKREGGLKCSAAGATAIHPMVGSQYSQVFQYC